ncbi:hypothetical protein HanIR_Chr09g0426391 [Helianthus annuus]|nr:hypothetical protein HanIR_Chr09g0426391 [Helianthus annuus]
MEHHTLQVKRGAPWLGLRRGNAKVEAFRWGPLVLKQSNVFFLILFNRGSIHTM